MDDKAIEHAHLLLDHLEKMGYCCVHQWWPKEAKRVPKIASDPRDVDITLWRCCKCGAETPKLPWR